MVSTPPFFIMIVRLPRNHPPLKGSLNTLPTNEFMGYDFDEWEMADDGMMYTVDIKGGYQPEDWDFVWTIDDELGASTQYRPSILAYLPVRIQKWFNEVELKGTWFYDACIIHTGMASRCTNFRICFQYASDALQFKLAWSGEQ